MNAASKSFSNSIRKLEAAFCIFLVGGFGFHIYQHSYRFPTIEEWIELAKSVLPDKPEPLFDEPELGWASAYQTTPQTNRKLRPVGSFKTTRDGITELDGNVWEWISTCYD